MAGAATLGFFAFSQLTGLYVAPLWLSLSIGTSMPLVDCTTAPLFFLSASRGLASGGR